MAHSVEELARELEEAPVVDGPHGFGAGQLEDGRPAIAVKLPKGSFKMAEKIASRHDCTCEKRLRKAETDLPLYLFAEKR